jgi:hypothetical protein
MLWQSYRIPPIQMLRTVIKNHADIGIAIYYVLNQDNYYGIFKFFNISEVIFARSYSGSHPQSL